MPQYNAFGAIDLEIDHPKYGIIPFTASPDDPEGAAIYAAALAGAYGPVAPYVPPPTPTPPPPMVPQVVTAVQAQQALLLAGKFASVQPAIDAIADPTQRGLVQIEWDRSQTFERQRPTLIALATALGMDDAELDALFTHAATL